MDDELRRYFIFILFYVISPSICLIIPRLPVWLFLLSGVASR